MYKKTRLFNNGTIQEMVKDFEKHRNHVHQAKKDMEVARKKAAQATIFFNTMDEFEDVYVAMIKKLLETKDWDKRKSIQLSYGKKLDILQTNINKYYRVMNPDEFIDEEEVVIHAELTDSRAEISKRMESLGNIVTKFQEALTPEPVA